MQPKNFNASKKTAKKKTAKKIAECDVAIVGGGIAGLYAAYRLRQTWESPDERTKLAKQLNLAPNGRLTVFIFEENPLELGGRLRTVKLPFPHGSVTTEVGAMRFTTRQILLRRLLHDLGINTTSFKAEGFDKSYFLRGQHFRDDELRNDSAPYNLADTPERNEKGKTPDELVAMVLERALKELVLVKGGLLRAKTLLVLEKLRDKILRTKLDHEDWKAIQEDARLLGDVRLRDIGLWNLIHHYLSPDAAQLVEDGFGYESVIGNWNLSDAIPWFIDDFGPGQSYESIEEGFSHVVECLQKLLKSETSRFTCEIFFNTRVRTLSVANEPNVTGVTPTTARAGHATLRYELKATQTALRYRHFNDHLLSQHKADSPEKKDKMSWYAFKANAVILAIPKQPLSKLNVSSLLGHRATFDKQTQWDNWKYADRQWRGTLDKVRAHRLAKLVQAYRTPWWRTPETPKGAGALIITDLPLRQLYYWDQEWLAKRGRYKFYDEAGDEITDPDANPTSAVSWSHTSTDTMSHTGGLLRQCSASTR